MTRGEELQAAPGARVFVTTSIEDVTKQILAPFPAGTSDADRTRIDPAPPARDDRLCEKPGSLRCQVASFFEGGAVPEDHADGDPRRPPGLRAGPRRRQLRRRDRQLDVAAPHRRLRVLSRVRRQGRQARRLLGEQRSVSTEAPFQGLHARPRPGRSGHGLRLPRQHQPPRHRLRSRGRAAVRPSDIRPLSDHARPSCCRTAARTTRRSLWPTPAASPVWRTSCKKHTGTLEAFKRGIVRHGEAGAGEACCGACSIPRSAPRMTRRTPSSRRS